jgi:pimeloyl-ACP methyl ester carboxylesterase
VSRILYLHGFASSPQSKKAQYFRERFAGQGLEMKIPDLSPDGLESLTITGQLRILEAAARGEPVSLIGSSMGGYLAALYASLHPEVETVVLMAPAFHFAERWLARIGPEQAARWKSDGYLEMPDYRTGGLARVGYGLIADGATYPPAPAFPQPALLFQGVRDDVVDYRGSIAYAAANPNVRLQLFDAGHELTEVVEEMWRPMMRFFTFL